MLALSPARLTRAASARYVRALGVAGTLWRTVLLFAFSVITLSLFLVLVLLVELGC